MFIFTLKKSLVPSSNSLASTRNSLVPNSNSLASTRRQDKLFKLLTQVALILAFIVYCDHHSFSLQAEPTIKKIDNPYDIIFKEGTLDDLKKDQVLKYKQSLSLPKNIKTKEKEQQRLERIKQMETRNNGVVQLVVKDEDKVSLNFTQADKSRLIGNFPDVIGNPMIMYFMESVIQDMAGSAGGSPFYIRNRIKASVISFTEVIEDEQIWNSKNIKTQSIKLLPFAKDKNHDRMKGFGDMEITLVMSPDVPGWYVSLAATTKENKIGYLRQLEVVLPERD